MGELKERLEAMAHEGEPLGSAEVMARARRSLEGKRSAGLARQLRGRRVLVPLVVAAALAVAAGGAVMITRGSGDDEPRVVASDGAGEQHRRSGNDSGAPVFLVPRTVPEGFGLLRVSGGDQPGLTGSRSGSPEWDRSQRWVRFDAAHERPVEVLTIQWGPGTSGLNSDPAGSQPPDGGQGSDDPLGAFRSESAPVTVRGHEGLYSQQNGWLAWEEPEGRVVLVGGTVAPPSFENPVVTPLARELLERVAEALEARGDGGFDLVAPPEGFELVAEWPGFGSEGTNPRTLVYQSSDGRGFQLHIVDDTEQPPGINLYSSDARLVEVRGQDAVVTPFLFSPPGVFDQQTLFLMGADLFVQWLEPGSVRVTVSGVGLDESEILAIARNLEAVDAQAWLNLQSQAGSDPPPTPASTIPEPTGAPPDNEDAARDAIIRAFTVWGALGTVEEAEANFDLIDDPHGLRQAIEQAVQNYPYEVSHDTYQVNEVRFLNATEAVVVYDILIDGTPRFPGRIGRAVLIDGTWKITRETACNDLSLPGARCPP
ncbi:MAG: hypothetical protein ACRDZ1_17560 [Acidimicrobiia bacterium]